MFQQVRGQALQRSIAVLGAVAFLVQGYNQSMMNGFLTLDTFLSTVPQVDTIHTKGAQLAQNAKIEGLSTCSAAHEMMLTNLCQAWLWPFTKLDVPLEPSLVY